MENCENKEEFMTLVDNKVEPWDRELVYELYNLTKKGLERSKSKRWNITQVSVDIHSKKSFSVRVQ